MKTKPSVDDLINREARRLARKRIEYELEVRSLPFPKDSALEIHITELLARDPTLRKIAATHVEAKTDAYTHGLRVLGLVDEPINLDIQL